MHHKRSPTIHVHPRATDAVAPILWRFPDVDDDDDPTIRCHYGQPVCRNGDGNLGCVPPRNLPSTVRVRDRSLAGRMTNNPSLSLRSPALSSSARRPDRELTSPSNTIGVSSNFAVRAVETKAARGERSFARTPRFFCRLFNVYSVCLVFTSYTHIALFLVKNLTENFPAKKCWGVSSLYKVQTIVKTFCELCFD